MAAHALNPQPGWTVVDACAAPGNKTSHLAGQACSGGCCICTDMESLYRQEKEAGDDRDSQSQHAEGNFGRYPLRDEPIIIIFRG